MYASLMQRGYSEGSQRLSKLRVPVLENLGSHEKENQVTLWIFASKGAPIPDLACHLSSLETAPMVSAMSHLSPLNNLIELRNTLHHPCAL